MAMKRTGQMAPTEGRLFKVKEAPLCMACGTELVAASSTEWVCNHPGCSEEGKLKLGQSRVETP
jgi:hypothetical protein